MAKPLTEELKQQWKDRILEQRNSGLSIPKWCRRYGVSLYNFRYWQAKLLPHSFNHASFSEVVSENNLGISLEYQGIKIHVSSGFSPQVLRECLEVIKKC
jgi:hypothetical protein